MEKLFSYRHISIWLVDGEYYVYSRETLKRVCPSIGMAREVAAGL